MEAIQFNKKTETLALEKLPIPQVTRPNDVLIKVAYAGICGTDLHIIGGEFPCSEKGPFTLGHEFSGTVIEVGGEVTIVQKGDRVSVDPNEGCRCCVHCRSGNPHFCQTGGINNTIGIYRNGGWATYCVAPMAAVHKLPDTITLEQAALTEPLSCLAHGWDLLNPVHVGAKILIIGAGIIGNLWVCALHLQGHRNVTISEPNEARLNLINNLDTGYELVTPAELKKRQEADKDYLFDVVIDCSGFCPAIEHAISLLQYGGKLCCFGVAPPHGKVTFSPFQLYLKELKIFAVNTNPLTFPKSIGLLEAMGDRYLDYNKLGIKTFALNQYNEAIELLKKGAISKAVFKL